MKIIETRLPGCVVIEPAVFGDERGYFYEGWNAARFGEHGRSHAERDARMARPRSPERKTPAPRGAAPAWGSTIKSSP